MTIKSIDKLKKGKISVDLTGPKGNAFYLIGLAKRLSKQLDKDYDDISEKMQSGDYENLVEVFEEEFGDFVDLYR